LGLNYFSSICIYWKWIIQTFGGEGTAEMAKTLGGQAHLTFLGILELVIVVLWFIPRTGVVGALLAMTYMSGAIAVHFVSNQPVAIPVAIEVLIWIATAVRFPEVKNRLFNTAA
jgi:hypothetical protein